MTGPTTPEQTTPGVSAAEAESRAAPSATQGDLAESTGQSADEGTLPGCDGAARAHQDSADYEAL